MKKKKSRLHEKQIVKLAWNTSNNIILGHLAVSYFLLHMYDASHHGSLDYKHGP